MTEDYCELCDLPRSQCIHGRPPPPPPAAPVRSAPVARTPRTSRPRTPGQPPPPPVVRRWTPSEDFRPPILSILADHDGLIDADDLMLELEILLEDVLTRGDHERSPQGGERWHTAVRRQRKALIDEGVLVPAQPGVWQLTPQGRDVR